MAEIPERCPECELLLTAGERVCPMCGYTDPVPALEARIRELEQERAKIKELATMLPYSIELLRKELGVKP